MKTQVNLKIDTEVKKKAQKTAKELGLSLSSVVNASLIQFARTGELHVTREYRMTPYLEKVIKKAREDEKKGLLYGPFDSVDEFIKHLNRKRK